MKAEAGLATWASPKSPTAKYRFRDTGGSFLSRLMILVPKVGRLIHADANGTAS
jgi:hypothetical protein